MSKHAKQRILERYALDLTDNEYRLLKQVIHVKGCIVDYGYNDEPIGYITFKGVPMKLIWIYDTRGRLVILTALPFIVEEYNQILESYKTINYYINVINRILDQVK